MDISVVIPLYNEDESLPELYAWIERVMAANHFSFEVIFVNDGSTDHSWDVITELAARSEHVKGIKFRRNYGKSPALYCGFKEAQGDVVITMDADLQDSPDEIPELYRMIKEDGYDLVSGYKQNRKPGRPAVEDHPHQALQRHGAQGERHQEPARLQLRTEGLSPRGGEEHRGVWRDAPLHALSGQERRFRQDCREARTPSGPQVRQVEVHGLEPLRQRLSRPADALVPRHLRQEAHARLRLPGHHHVHHRFPGSPLRGWAESLGALTMAYPCVWSPTRPTSTSR